MTLYIAVTPDKLELPMYVSDSAQAMASWAGIKLTSLHQMCTRNKNLPPFSPKGKGGSVQSQFRVRRITIEEE